MNKLIKKWTFTHSVYQDDQFFGSFSHNLTLYKEPEDEKNYPMEIYSIIWEIPALLETVKAQISVLKMVIYDHRNLFEIQKDVLDFLFDFGFCLDNSIDPDCKFIQQDYELDEYA